MVIKTFRQKVGRFSSDNFPEARADICEIFAGFYPNETLKVTKSE